MSDGTTPPPVPWAQQVIFSNVKKVLGFESDYTPFDEDIAMHIDSAFATLHQLGVGPEEPFMLTSREEVWAEFAEGKAYLASVRSYIYISVRLLFDPPEMSYVLTALENQKKELEWRLNVAEDNARRKE